MPQVLVGIGAVDRTMTIGAPPQEGHRFHRRDRLAGSAREIPCDRRVGGDPRPAHLMVERVVQRMTGETDRRLRRRHQVLRHRAVWVMTDHAPLNHGRVLEGPGADDVPVTGGALIVGSPEGRSRIPMRIVAGHTSEGALSYRVMGGELEARLDARMTLYAERGRLVGFPPEAPPPRGAKVVPRSVVTVVTVGTHHVRRIVVSPHPREMAGEAETVAVETILGRRKPNVGVLFAVRVEAAAAMTGFAVGVIRGHARVTLDFLVTYGALLCADALRPRDDRNASRPERRPLDPCACEENARDGEPEEAGGA